MLRRVKRKLSSLDGIRGMVFFRMVTRLMLMFLRGRGIEKRKRVAVTKVGWVVGVV